MEEIIRYLFAGFGIGCVVFGILTYYLVGKFERKGK